MAGLSRPLLAIAALLVIPVLAITLPACRRAPRPAASPAASFSVAGVPVEAPDLALEVVEVRGDLHEGYMSWVCLVRCKAPDGCRADLRATVVYRSGGESERITLSGPVDVPIGARARLSSVQRPPHRVDSVEKVAIRVVRRFAAGDPVPTPEY